ncbi:MAG: molybdopterin oxidoreductase family protein [Vicinamibacterales bacterium]
MTYARLDTQGLQWPCPTEEHPGTSILHEEAFAIGPRAALATVPFEPTPEVITAEYPLRLITGRSLYQFNAGTMTGRTPNNALKPADVVSLSSSEADRLAIQPGETVRITSRYGSIGLPAHVDAGLRPGDVFATFQQPSSLVNLVTSPHRDPITSTPEYKVTAVRVEPGQRPMQTAGGRLVHAENVA